MKAKNQDRRSLMLRKLTNVCDVSFSLSCNRGAGVREYVKFEYGEQVRVQNSTQRFALVKTSTLSDEHFMSVMSWPDFRQMIDHLVNELTEMCDCYCDVEIWTFNNVFHDILKDRRLIKMHIQQYYDGLE